MRRIYIEDGVEAEIEDLRGATSFEAWVTEACRTRLWEERLQRFAIEAWTGELHVAIVEEGSFESVLMWRCHLSGVGDTMLPVIAADGAGKQAWIELMALELNYMDGPPVSWRRYDEWRSDGAEYLRAPPVEDSQ